MSERVLGRADARPSMPAAFVPHGKDRIMKPPRFAFVALLLAAVISCPSVAQERTVRILSGASAGGSSDFATRLLAEALGPVLGAPVGGEKRHGRTGIVP